MWVTWLRGNYKCFFVCRLLIFQRPSHFSTSLECRSCLIFWWLIFRIFSQAQLFLFFSCILLLPLFFAWMGRLRAPRVLQVLTDSHWLIAIISIRQRRHDWYGYGQVRAYISPIYMHISAIYGWTTGEVSPRQSGMWSS